LAGKLYIVQFSLFFLLSIIIIEFSCPTLAVMQTTPNSSSGFGNTARLRTPFLPPIPARWMIRNDGSLRIPTPKKATSTPDLSQNHSWSNSSYPPNIGSVFS
jgi:hypothetical protein